MISYYDWRSRNSDGCCKGCKDRCIEPNCHNTCEKYKVECEEWKEWKAKVKAERDNAVNYDNMRSNHIHKTKSYMKKHKFM